MERGPFVEKRPMQGRHRASRVWPGGQARAERVGFQLFRRAPCEPEGSRVARLRLRVDRPTLWPRAQALPLLAATSHIAGSDSGSS